MKNLIKLIDVKSIMTLTMTGIFSYLAIRGSLTGEQFMFVFGLVIAFYFTKKDKTV